MTRPFKYLPQGVQVNLGKQELTFLASVPELLASVDEDSADPAYARLHVAAYPDDQPAQEDLESITGPDLAEIRGSDRAGFLAALERIESTGGLLSDEEAESWLTVLGDTRLALAARIGVTEPSDWERSPDPRDPAQAALGFLSYLQAELVDILMERL